MRIIHTADWHIGQTLAGYGRENEHRAVLDQLVTLVAEREIDALVIAGDVFDHQNPSGEAQRLFYETLVRLNRARPQMTMVVTAGNHDAAGRLEAPRALLNAINAHVVGNVRRLDGRIADGRRHLVPLKTPRGDIAAHVLAVSYPTAACLPALGRFDATAEAGSPIIRATAALYGELMDATRAASAGLPLIVTGHLHVAGGVTSEGAERRILIGGQHAVPTDIFPSEAVYVALGHLHKAQSVGRESVRYSGSLLPLSATELSYRHGVTLLTLDGGHITTEHIPLQRPVPFLRLPETGDTRLDELHARFAALDLAPDLPDDDKPFVQIRLSRDGLTAGFRAEADRIAEDFPVRVVDVKLTPHADSQENAPDTEPDIRLADLQPEALFRQAFARTHENVEPTDAHVRAFHIAAARAEA
jgi:exonuclease SbcD